MSWQNLSEDIQDMFSLMVVPSQKGMTVFRRKGAITAPPSTCDEKWTISESFISKVENFKLTSFTIPVSRSSCDLCGGILEKREGLKKGIHIELHKYPQSRYCKQ